MLLCFFGGPLNIFSKCRLSTKYFQSFANFDHRFPSSWPNEGQGLKGSIENTFYVWFSGVSTREPGKAAWNSLFPVLLLLPLTLATRFNAGLFSNHVITRTTQVPYQFFPTEAGVTRRACAFNLLSKGIRVLSFSRWKGTDPVSFDYKKCWTTWVPSIRWFS